MKPDFKLEIEKCLEVLEDIKADPVLVANIKDFVSTYEGGNLDKLYLLVVSLTVAVHNFNKVTIKSGAFDQVILNKLKMEEKLQEIGDELSAVTEENDDVPDFEESPTP